MAEFTIQGTTAPFISAQLAQGETATGKRQPVTSADLRDRGEAVLTHSLPHSLPHALGVSVRLSASLPKHSQYYIPVS